jgi:hypothetical protein
MIYALGIRSRSTVKCVARIRVREDGGSITQEEDVQIIFGEDRIDPSFSMVLEDKEYGLS